MCVLKCVYYIKCVCSTHERGQKVKLLLSFANKEDRRREKKRKKVHMKRGATQTREKTERERETERPETDPKKLSSRSSVCLFFVKKRVISLLSLSVGTHHKSLNRAV